ncbi:MAG: chloramphenicol-sensitive protein RarD [Yoonia sp.]|jgi:chloramphenicol-sensitive protein RarD
MQWAFFMVQVRDYPPIPDKGETIMRDDQKGVLAIITACIVWGLSPLYFAQVTHVPPLEVLSYRCLWSLAFFVLILAVQGRLSEVSTAIANPRQMLIILAAAVLIAINWFGFIYAISTGQGIEASLGYYIFPLVAVVIGMGVFGEVLRRAQWIAVGLATIGVAVLTIGLGVAPWIAFVLAGTFGAYGMIKKQLNLGPVVSVTAEVLLIAPFAALWIAFRGTGAGGDNDLATHAILALSGPLTASPLIMFSFAARRVRMATVGLVQYLNPTLQFGCAALIMGEAVTRWHAIAFPIIWTALIVYSVSLWRQDRAVANPASSAATSSTT